MCMCACMRACVHACVRACVRACMRACVCGTNLHRCVCCCVKTNTCAQMFCNIFFFWTTQKKNSKKFSSELTAALGFVQVIYKIFWLCVSVIDMHIELYAKHKMRKKIYHSGQNKTATIASTAALGCVHVNRLCITV